LCIFVSILIGRNRKPQKHIIGVRANIGSHPTVITIFVWTYQIIDTTLPHSLNSFFGTQFSDFQTIWVLADLVLLMGVVKKSVFHGLVVFYPIYCDFMPRMDIEEYDTIGLNILCATAFGYVLNFIESADKR